MSTSVWVSSMYCRVLVLAGIAALVVAGCASHTSNPRSDVGLSSGAADAVTIQTFQFRPPSLDVRAGTRVTWPNQDDILHTVTAGTPEIRDAWFESPLDGKGAAFSFTFTQPGTYMYFCARHPSMRGEVRVH
jgi:plastocyanin